MRFLRRAAATVRLGERGFFSPVTSTSASPACAIAGKKLSAGSREATQLVVHRAGGSGQQLVQQANDNGGRDNVSVILVRVLKSFPARSGLVDRLKSWFR